MENTDGINPQSFIEQTLFSTLRIELLDDKNNLQIIGTGFMIRIDFPQNPKEALILLVSNKHILAGKEKFSIAFHRRQIKSDLPQLKETLTYHTASYTKNLFLHPDPKIDLACVNISGVISKLHSKIYFKSLTRTVFANFNEPELEPGQRVIFVVNVK